MRVADISWMEKKDRQYRGRNDYLILAMILLGLLALSYLGDQPSITGFAIFKQGGVSMDIDFGSQKLPLGASIEATINGQKYAKNLISIIGSPYEIEYDGAVVYGWDTRLVVPLESFDVLNTLKPGSYTVDLVLSANNEIISLKTLTVEIIDTRQPETPATVPPVFKQPLYKRPYERPALPESEPVMPPESPSSPQPEPASEPVESPAPSVPDATPVEEPAQEPSNVEEVEETVPLIEPLVEPPAQAPKIYPEARLVVDNIGVERLVIPSYVDPSREPIFGVNTFKVTISGEPVFKTFAAGECGGAIPCNCTNMVAVDRNMSVGSDFVLNGTCTESGLSMADGVHLDCGSDVNSNITGDGGISDVGINLSGADRAIVSNCTIVKYGISVSFSTAHNNTVTRINSTNASRTDFRFNDDASGNNTISHSTCNDPQHGGTTPCIDFLNGGDYNLIYNNTFIDSTGAEEGIFLRSGAEWNNITNNTFNMSGGSRTQVSNLPTGGTANNTIWGNIFDQFAFEDISKNNTQVRNNSYCNSVGNTYVNGAENQRIFGDCGPFPKLSTIQINSTSNGIYVVGATERDQVNITNLTFAVGNMNYTGTTINLSVADTGNFASYVYLQHMDGNTINCNRVHLNGSAVGGSGANAFEIGDSSNITISNCNFLNWKRGLNFDDLGATSSSQSFVIRNNVFNDTNNSASIMILDNTFQNNLITNNTFIGMRSSTAITAFIYFSGGGDGNTISNNTFDNLGGTAVAEYGIWFRAGAQFNNVTNNTFNITNSTVGQNYAIIIDNSTTADNNTIYRNIFINEVQDPVDEKSNRNFFNQSEIGNFWAAFNDSSEGCDVTLMRGDSDGNVLCDASFNVSNYTGITVTDAYPSTRSFPDNDVDDDTFLNFKINNTHPIDCDDADALTRPLVNHTTGQSITKNIRICPGAYNASITIDNSSVSFDCNSTAIFRSTIADG